MTWRVIDPGVLIWILAAIMIAAIGIYAKVAIDITSIEFTIFFILAIQMVQMALIRHIVSHLDDDEEGKE